MSVNLHALRLELAIREHINGVSHVKAKHLTDEMGHSAIEIGRALVELKEQGDVVQINGNTPATYRITLDEEGC